MSLVGRGIPAFSEEQYATYAQISPRLLGRGERQWSGVLRYLQVTDLFLVFCRSVLRRKKSGTVLERGFFHLSHKLIHSCWISSMYQWAYESLSRCFLRIGRQAFETLGVLVFLRVS